MGYEEFDQLHSPSATSLTTLLVHVIDITPQDSLLFQNLLQFLEIAIDNRFIETLCAFGVKPRRLSQADVPISQEESPNPFDGRLISCDLQNLVFEIAFADRPASLCLMLNPVDQDLFFIACEYLTFLLGKFCWLMQLKKVRMKSMIRNLKLPSSLQNLPVLWVRMKPLHGIFELVFLSFLSIWVYGLSGVGLARLTCLDLGKGMQP